MVGVFWLNLPRYVLSCILGILPTKKYLCQPKIQSMKHFFLAFALFISVFTFAQNHLTTEEISLKNGNFTIDGIVSFNETEKQPLLIYVSGSGNIDRDGNQAGTTVKADYIKQLSDSLNAHGIAVFRFDKRTANPKNSTFIDESIQFEDFVSDVKTIIMHFKNDVRFSSINILGHSQGSLVAMLACDEHIKSFISVAGPAETVEETLISQLNKQAPTLANKAREHFSELMATDTIVQVHPFLVSIFQPVNQKFLKSYNTYQPIEEINKLNIPILIINGNVDLQVPVRDAQKLDAVAKNSRLVIIENMTHVLKRIQNPNENILSYTNPKYPIPSELVTAIVNFLTSAKK